MDTALPTASKVVNICGTKGKNAREMIGDGEG